MAPETPPLISSARNLSIRSPIQAKVEQLQVIAGVGAAVAEGTSGHGSGRVT